MESYYAEIGHSHLQVFLSHLLTYSLPHAVCITVWVITLVIPCMCVFMRVRVHILRRSFSIMALWASREAGVIICKQIICRLDELSRWLYPDAGPTTIHGQYFSKMIFSTYLKTNLNYWTICWPYEILNHIGLYILLAELSNQIEAVTIFIMIVMLGEYEVVSILVHTYHYYNHGYVSIHQHFATQQVYITSQEGLSHLLQTILRPRFWSWNKFCWL